MPIQLDIFHPGRILIVVGRGNITLQEYGDLIARVVQEGVTHYRKIIDATARASDAVTMDVLLKADELTRNLKNRPRGPLALVVDRARGELARAWLRTLPTVDRASAAYSSRGRRAPG